MTDAALSTPATPAKASAKRSTASTFTLRLIAGIAILALWEAVVRLFAPAYVAKPSGIVVAIPKVMTDPAFLNAAAATLTAVAQGLAIALVFGTALGLLIGRSMTADRTLRHYVNGFYAVPMVVVLPLFSLWFGYSGATRLAVIVFSSLFSIIVNVADGARAVPREYIEVSRSFRAGRISTLLEIVLPASLPYFLAGLRLAAGRALIGAVVAEFFTAIGGLGYFILFKSRTFNHSEAFVGVLLLAGFGVCFDMLVNGSIRRFLPWYRRDEAAN